MARSLGHRSRQANMEDDVDSSDQFGPAPITLPDNGASPRVLYIDIDDDLPMLLDRVEDSGSPAIIVLHEGARAVHGAVAARLLKRRADAAGIPIVAVTTDRIAIAQLGGVGIPCVSTVGDARVALNEVTGTVATANGPQAATVDAADANAPTLFDL
ncbi:MAG: hypothetical protein JWO42_3994, partial [Chloroflexi bacterium]|nr:hypothetical protein [Chloroflexota bacterium]